MRRVALLDRIRNSNFIIKPKAYWNYDTMRYNFNVDIDISNEYNGKHNVGDVHKNNSNQEYVIVGICGRASGGAPLFTIEFLNTKYQTYVTGSNMSDGTIKDHFEPNVCGAGWIGYGDFRKSKDYSHWRSLIKRLFYKKHKSHKHYRGVNIDERWLDFGIFQEDITKLKGFDRELFETDEIVMDKDIGCYNLDENIYSPDTCEFIPREINDKIQLKHQDFIKYSYHNMIEFIHYNKTYVEETLKISAKGVNLVLTGKKVNHKGWVVEKVEPEEISFEYLMSLDEQVNNIKREYEDIIKYYHKRKFKATNHKTNKIYYCHNGGIFARFFDLTSGNISQCLNGHKDRYRGWEFELVNNFPSKINELNYVKYFEKTYGELI